MKPAEWTVEPGERLESVAYRFGVAPAALWDDPANAELRELRTSRENLTPGDVLRAPAKKVKREPANPGVIARFRRKYAPAWLRITMWIDDAPRANGDCAVVVDGQLVRLVLNEEGIVDCPVPMAAATATLMVFYGSQTPDVVLDLRAGESATELEVDETVLRIRSQMSNTHPAPDTTS